MVAYQSGHPRQAVELITHALGLKPSTAVYHFNLGAAQAALGQLDEAIANYRLALRLQADFPEVHNNLGNALCRQDKLDEALTHLQETARVRPNDAETHNNLGIAWHRQGAFDKAMVHYNLAVEFKPNYDEAHWNRALLLLTLGDFQRGWPEYEWRWTQPRFKARGLAQPLWDGSPLAGRTIFVYAEQGIGDTLQFIRYASLIKERGGKVVFECQPSLPRLLAGAMGIDHLLAIGAPLPAFDVQAPLLSLPGIFHANLENIPQSVPYLQAEAELIEHWRQKLQAVPGCRIGIVWQGNPENPHDKPRSIPLDCFAKLAAVPGVQLISLQCGPGTDQMRGRAADFPLLDLTPDLGEGGDSLANIAAIIHNVDLVISCDTAIAHLAGAMGRPVWVALPFVPDWRWLLGREDSLWYPTLRLFRQTSRGNWQDVFEPH